MPCRAKVGLRRWPGVAQEDISRPWLVPQAVQAPGRHPTWVAVGGQKPLPGDEVKAPSALVPMPWGPGHGEGRGTGGEGGFEWRGLLIPRAGCRGTRRAGGRKAQSFPSVTGVVRSVSYCSLGTGSGLRAVRGTKNRRGQCQIAYCLKRRFWVCFFFLKVNHYRENGGEKKNKTTQYEPREGRQHFI